MAVTVRPELLASAGRSAREVADGPLVTAPTSISGAEDTVGAARLGGLESNAPLGSLLAGWTTAARGIQAKTRSTGDKLVTTANTYSATDTVDAELFAQVPVDPRYRRYA